MFVYPNGAKKSLTFTIDDGYVDMDRKFLEILKPHGIKGTFNLCSDSMSHLTPEGYREFYLGYEIQNHCKAHPYAYTAERLKPIKNELFNPELADENYLYAVENKPGMYHFKAPNGWRRLADDETYMRLVDECTVELEEIFGKGSVRGFVWPFGEQNNEKVFNYIKSRGFFGIRKTGCVGSSTGFRLPADRFAWSYNADCSNLLSLMEEYESVSDEGELRFFSFGVHSVDFERAGKWDDLIEFARRYGDRPSDFWYASVGEIFDYEDAVKLAYVGEGVVKNNADIPIYIKLKDKTFRILPSEVYCLSE